MVVLAIDARRISLLGHGIGHCRRIVALHVSELAPPGAD